MNSIEDNVGVGSMNELDMLDMLVSNGSNMEVLSVIKGILVDIIGVCEKVGVLKEGVGVGKKESGSEKEGDSDETVIVVRRGCCVEVGISSMLDCMENRMEEAGKDLVGETDSDRIGIDVSTDCIENTMDIIGTEVDGRTCIFVLSIEATNGRERVVIVAVDVVGIVVVKGNIVGWKV